ncbi:hypothetical protein pipiens_014680 [Culex pipiens pipiens]|uniref:BDBT FKBP like N-terminal domain-containing protein n=1 Tax=Culex pipiens pipiens TaxID=38569 RepID=A0ABD1CTM9_CULPP
MGLLSKIAILLGVGTITYVIRWHYIGRLYRSKRTFSSQELVVITGASSGIGLAVVKDLVRRGCHLVLGCRNEAAGQIVCDQLRKQFGSEVLVDVYFVDLGSLKSIVSFVDKVGLLGKPVYALVNNAGIFYAPPALTADQIEQTFEINYLGHYLLTILLLPKLKQHPNRSRIVNVVSKAQICVERFPDTELHQLYDDSPQNRFRAYQYSKFCLVLFAHKLSSILANSNVTVHCVDPGNVETAIYRHFPQLNNKVLYYLQKPIRLLAVKTPREGTRESNFLKLDEPGNEQWISMGSSVTPIDYYVEQILAQMFTNERSRCTISCKSGSVSFVLELLRIEDNEYYFTRSSAQMLTLAKQYKENGVKCFAKYPLLAHQFFNRAAKCLLSFAPLEYLDPAIEGADTIASIQSLLETLNLNIAACLIKQNRFDDALHMLEYVDRQNNPSPKAIYRKALAQFHVKQYTEAVKTLQRIDYATNKECSTLYANIVTNLEKEKEKYNSMVRKMFG